MPSAHVITVEFEIEPGRYDDFLPLMVENARLSRARETGCRRFDVCTDASRPDAVFLYEIYDDRLAFEAHLASAHFVAFDTATRGMVAGKLVRELTLRASADDHGARPIVDNLIDTSEVEV